MAILDIKLTGGYVYDGTGAPARRLDVGIQDDRIDAMGDLRNEKARREIDVEGLAVAPGFIDVHTHDDRALLSTPRMQPKVSQGVTTVVVGNCGISLAPLVTDSVPPPLDLIGDNDSFRYASFGAYLDRLDAHGVAVNVVPLIGHTTLRVGAVSELDRAATETECARMREKVDEAMRAGAWGLSTGTFYPPAKAATAAEIIAVGEPLQRHGGLYVTHMRNEGDQVLQSLEETFLIGRSLDVHVVISHHKVAGIANHGRSVETLSRIEKAMSEQRVSLDCYPYNASSTMLHPDLIERASGVQIAWSEAQPRFNGWMLRDVAGELGCSEKEAAARLVPAGAIYFLMDEADVRRILAFRRTMVGSDGLPHDAHPHPRLWGSFPRVLGHYSRELKLFPLEEAVQKMTGLPAAEFGIPERGLLRTGYFADIVVFDPATVASTADFDKPTEPATGIEHVFVNGRPAGKGKETTRHGAVLRRKGSPSRA